MPKITLSSSIFNNKTASITLNAIDGNTYNLGSQTLPYDYTSEMIYGTYNLFFAVSGVTCQVVIPPTCDLKYDVITITPPPTPAPTPAPVFSAFLRDGSVYENIYQTNVFDPYSSLTGIRLDLFTYDNNVPKRVVIKQDTTVLFDSGYLGDASLYGIDGTNRTYVSDALNGKLDVVSGFNYPNILTTNSESDGYPAINNDLTNAVNTVFAKNPGGPITIIVYSLSYYNNQTSYDLYLNLF